MATTKELETKVNNITSRLSDLRDDTAVLQNELATVVNRIEQDMKRVITEIKTNKG